MKESLSLKKKQLLRNNEYYAMQSIFDELYDKSKHGVRFTNLMEHISSEDNILLAYRNIKNNKGSTTAGTDNVSISFYKEWQKDKFVKYIQDKLANYYPKSVRRVEIPKANGKTRPLGIPCMDDRIVQQCIKQILEPICEAKFHKHSYGFRPNRSTEHAIARSMALINLGKFHYVVDIDIKGFFDNVNHAKLKKQLWSLGIQDKNLISVIGKILKSEIEGVGVPTKGTPQGGIISPLLSNIVLNELDWWLSSQWETAKTRVEYVNRHSNLKRTSQLKEFWFVRYADDFKIFCRDYKTAQKVFNATKQWLLERLGLEISPEKSKITNIRKKKTEFLGIVLYVKSKGNKYVCQSNMSEKAKKSVKEKIRKQIIQIQKKNCREEVFKLNSIILGMHNYYRCATNVSVDFAEINFLVGKTLYNRLKLKITNKQYQAKSYKKLYGDYKGKIRSVHEVTIFPIYGVKTRPPMCFSQEITNYTEYGRKQIHRKLSNMNYLIQYLLRHNYKSESTEYEDNKLSLIAGQGGRCFVTSKPLEIGKMECHHKKPKHLGGTDEYKNLVWLHKDVHTLIHSTKDETIEKYLSILNLDDIGLKRVNSLRKRVGNLAI